MSIVCFSYCITLFSLICVSLFSKVVEVAWYVTTEIDSEYEAEDFPLVILWSRYWCSKYLTNLFRKADNRESLTLLLSLVHLSSRLIQTVLKKLANVIVVRGSSEEGEVAGDHHASFEEKKVDW